LGLAAPSQAATLTIKGSDSLVILARKWAELYSTKHPATKIQVAGGGTSAGFAALQNHSADLAAASRPIKFEEMARCLDSLGKRPTEYKVCLDGLSIYVNEGNPVEELTLEQLKLIFTGRIQDWNQLGGHAAPITLYGRGNNSSTGEFFKEQVLENGDFSANAQTVPGTAALLRALAGDKNGIGFGGPASGQGARTLKLKTGSSGAALMPTEASVGQGLYPICRYLYLYVNPALDRGEIAAFLNWIRSDEGQRVAKEMGCYPLPAHLREK